MRRGERVKYYGSISDEKDLVTKEYVDGKNTGVADGSITLAKLGSDVIQTLDGKRVRRNLLDNWYFKNPVNTRGQTSYSGTSTPTIDKWYTNGTTTLSDAGLVANNGGNVYILYYPLDDNLKKQLVGQTVTVSILTNLGLASGSDVIPSTIPENWDTGGANFGDFYIDIYGSDQSNGYKELRIFSVSSTENITIIAVKLELGIGQTLAYQDSSGNWVLNEVPDYNEELLKCQDDPFGIKYPQPILIDTAGVVVLNESWGGKNIYATQGNNIQFNTTIMQALPDGWWCRIHNLFIQSSVTWAATQSAVGIYNIAQGLAYGAADGGVAVPVNRYIEITRVAWNVIVLNGNFADHNTTSGTSAPSGGSNGDIYIQYS